MEMKYWYLVKVGGVDLISFIVLAITEKRARDKVALGSQNVRVDRLSWIALKQLTGCMIPQWCNSDDLASGPISFQKSGHVITIAM